MFGTSMNRFRQLRRHLKSELTWHRVPVALRETGRVGGVFLPTLVGGPTLVGCEVACAKVRGAVTLRMTRCSFGT